jgi:hypothetical protein
MSHIAATEAMAAQSLGIVGFWLCHGVDKN